MTIPELYELFLSTDGVSTDTRTVGENQIYFALKGDNFDGNHFAEKAIESGARFAIIDDDQFHSESTILVQDVLRTLQALSSYHRDQLKIPIIGLTGSNGKTTTKELITAVLSTSYKVASTKGNLNNHIGVPLTLLSINREHEISVIEMGANHQKEIEFLCSICKPDYGYITNFGKAHLEGFGGVQGVIQGKTELYQFLRDNDKTVFVNNDDPIQVKKAEGIKQISFGQSQGADIIITNAEPDTSRLEASYAGLTIRSKLTGSYNFSNMSSAIAIGQHFGIKPEMIQSGLEGYIPSNNRSQITRSERNILVIDAYNANPTSMEAAIKNMEAMDASCKWLILGDMFELGEHESEEHEYIANKALSGNFEKVIVVGKAFSKTQANGTLKFGSTADFIEWMKDQTIEGKTILLKGSRGMAIEQAIQYL